MKDVETMEHCAEKLQALQRHMQQTEHKLETLQEALLAASEQQERLQDELDALEKIAVIAATAKNEDELLEHATQFIGENFYPDSFGLLLADQKNNLLRPHRSYRGVNSTNLMSQGITGQVLRSGQSWNVPDVTQEPAFLSVEPGTKSEICVPLKIGSQIIGVINAESKRPCAFSDTDEQLLTLFANQLVANIEKIRLLGKVARSLQRERQLVEISRAIGQAEDLPTLLANVIRLTAQLTGAIAGRFGLLIDDQIIIYYPYNMPHNFNLQPSPKGRGTAWYIIESGQSLLLDDYQQHPRAQHAWIKSGVGAYLGIPIISGNDFLGTLELFCWGSEAQFRQRDLSLLEIVGRQTGTAIQNNRLFAAVQERASALAAVLSRREELDEMKNQFVENVSHELRTPLGIILGYSELLENENIGPLPPAQMQAVQVIAGRARMLNNLVDDLSALIAAGTQDFHDEDVDLRSLVTTIILEFKVQAEEAEISLFSEIKSDLPIIKGHQVHLHRVFDNLIANAFKFTPAGGTISLIMWAEEGEVVIEVADTGAGIPEEKLDRIFERFYKVDTLEARKKKGTGLGLALVREIVSAHYGTVSVRSKVDVGTTFQIRLPVKAR